MNLREIMNVGFAWKIVQRWCCLTVAIPCASAASATGTFNFHFCHLLFIDCFHISNSLNIVTSIFYRNARSQSCPFCRGSLKRVNSRDLWVVINNGDIIDTLTLARENLRRFYLYIEQLPLLMPETHAIVSDYMI